MNLLRIEGVNLGHNILDTEDLSTRRGGSLMLLEAIYRVEARFSDCLEAISTGASVGLFKVLPDKCPTDIAKSVRDMLSGDRLFQHGTFVIDLVEAANFRQATESTIAANRWQQMQRLSFSTTGLSACSSGVCEVDELRPVTGQITKAKKDVPASASVEQRWKFGVNNKREFYRRQLDRDGTLGRYDNVAFTTDFEGIATEPVIPLDPRTLSGKIAVFYADGNKFGRIAQDCEDDTSLRAWDNYLKGQRKALLAAVVERAMANKHWQTSAGALRLETLLWGGDELMFVVPGWCGLELADLFFKTTNDMRYPANAEQPLTHACGLVFCHHQAPISRIGTLVKELAERGKNSAKNLNTLHWMALESFDQAGGDLDAFLARRFPAQQQNGTQLVDWPSLALSPDAVARLARDLPKLKDDLPRSAIVRTVRAIAEGSAFDNANKAAALLTRSYAQVGKASSIAPGVFEDLWRELHPSRSSWSDKAISPSDLATWVKLVELWDYCPDWGDSPPSSGDAARAKTPTEEQP